MTTIFKSTGKERGKLITFEGIECSGKGTQIRKSLDYLSQHGRKAVRGREPGGTLYGEGLRVILKNPEIALPAIFEAVKNHSDFDRDKLAQALAMGFADKFERTGECELFLYSASRAEFAKWLKELLDEGISILADRLHDSTRAYQGGGRQLATNERERRAINEINAFALRGLWPDKTFFLDIPVEMMLERMRIVDGQDADKNSFFETTCGRDFFQRVHDEYHLIAQEEPNRFIIIDGEKPADEVFEQIRPYLDSLFGISYSD